MIEDSEHWGGIWAFPRPESEHEEQDTFDV